MSTSNPPSITVVSGPTAGSVLTLDQVLADFSIGSGDGVHLSVAGAGVSSIHATAFLDDEGRVTLVDAQSGTGVFVNGTQVSEHVLFEGDEISLGPPNAPGSGKLRFGVADAAPLIDLGDSAAAEFAAIDGLEPLTAEPGLMAEPAGIGDISVSLPSFDEPAASSPTDDFPPPEMLAEPEAPPPPPVAKAAPAKPVGSGLSSTPPTAPRPASNAPRKTTAKHTSTGDDDPLAGLAESLGAKSGERFVPPPAVAPPPQAMPGKKGASPAIMAARVAAVALVLAGLSWWGFRKYSDSIVVPVVDTYQPNPVEPGQTLTITGSGYGLDPDPTIVKVMIGSTEAHVLDANPTRINVTAPESLVTAGSQTVPLTVTTAAGATSTARLLKVVVAPKIASLAPRVALSGDEIAIAGKWLATANTKPTVTVAGNEAEILEATPARIRIKVPEVSAREGQRISVKVALGADVGKEALLNFGRLPFVETVSPERALPGEVVTVTGLGLTGSDLFVTVGSRSAAVLSATDAEIRISVPGTRLPENAGTRDVIVNAAGRASMTKVLDVRRDSASTYSPRFFVEILEGGRAAVSCEVSPLMVLGSDASSVKRAHDAAAKLNALALQARANRVQFVAGDVAISAAGSPVITVASSDGSGNARAMAGLWAAELSDIFDLFFQGRRPSRAIELSPDGKALVDIFGVARRRSSEVGVPQGLLMSPDPNWVRSLAALATAPALGASEVNSLLDGAWTGVIEVPGAIQPRKVDISLTATPSGVFGQKRAKGGKLSSDVPLDGISFSRRELRFTFVDAGENLTYIGRLDGDTIDGNVTKGSGVKVGKLTFKLIR